MARADGLLREGRLRATEEEATSDSQVQADGRRLVDDDDAEAVGQIEDLLGIGVVRRPERVGPEPPEECEVVHHRRVVVTPTVHVEVLVLSEPAEVEGFVVDEEARPVDAYGPDADGDHVTVDQAVLVHEVDLQLVEVAVAGLPEGGIGHPQLGLLARRTGHDLSLGVVELEPDRRVPFAAPPSATTAVRQRTIPVPSSSSVMTVASAMWDGGVEYNHTARWSPA